MVGAQPAEIVEEARALRDPGALAELLGIEALERDRRVARGGGSERGEALTELGAALLAAEAVEPRETVEVNAGVAHLRAGVYGVGGPEIHGSLGTRPRARGPNALGAPAALTACSIALP